MSASNNGFEKDPERARQAGKKGGAKRGLKSIIKDVLNEKVSDKDRIELAERLGIDCDFTQGEAAIRTIVMNMIKHGDIKRLSELMKITGEYDEKIKLDVTHTPVTININGIKIDSEK